MTPEQWSRVGELFNAAIELEPETRGLFLEENCRNDPSLRLEVERLLRAGDESTDFLEIPPVQLASLLEKLSESGRSFADEQIVSGRFRIICLLGRGGMGEVYQAEDLALGGEIAIKTIRAEIASNIDALVRFRREIHAGRSVTHPNVCRIFDINSASTIHGTSITYLTMELLHGETLDTLIRRDAPLASERALLVGRQIASALKAAHEAGIVHRDLKPTNVMLATGRPESYSSETNGGGSTRLVVMDFGLSYFLDPHSDLEASATTQTLVGTPDYMAPEQLDGEPITAATDVFAFGIMMYELLTGAFPFPRASSFSAARARFGMSSAPPAVLVTSLPGAWQRFLLKCLERRPDQRFANGEELLAALSGVDSPATGDETGSEDMPPRGPRKTFSRYFLVAAALAVVLVVVGAIAAGGLVHRLFLGASKSIAVLPFRNRISDPQIDYLSHGITETLIQDLSRIPPHRVLSAAAVARYEKSAIDPVQAGRELGVDRVLSGSISQVGDELLIDAQLYDVHTGEQVWRHSYQRKVASLSTTLEEFSTEVTDNLRLHLSGPLKERLDRQYAIGSEAYRDYLKARFEMSKRTPEGLDAAMRLFDGVISRDPSYAPAWAAQAGVYNLMAFFGGRGGGQEPIQALRRSQAAAAHALDLDSTLAEAWSSLAYVQMQADYQWSEAERNFHRAIELDPNLADAHDAYGYELTALGRFDEAIREIKMAESIAPDSLAYRAVRAVFLHHARRYEESLQLLLPVKGHFSNSSTVGYLIARNYWAESKPAQALALLQEDPPAGLLDIRIPLFIMAFAKAGDYSQASKLRSEYVPHSGTTSWYYLSLEDSAFGRFSDSIDDLEKAWQQRADSVMLLGVDPLVDPLRGNARFQSLLRRINLAKAASPR